MERDRTTVRGLAAAGVLAAIAVAALLVGVRAPLGSANVALVLALVVTAAAASGGRLPGVATGVAAAISFNFFHTRPYNSLRVQDSKDIVTVLLLAAMGVVVGEIARRWNESQEAARRSSRELERLTDVAAMAAAGAPAHEVLARVQEEIAEDLHLADVILLPSEPDGSRPVLDHRGVVDQQVHHYVPGGFAVPETGVDLEVTYRGRSFGRLVLVPLPGVGVSRAQYRSAVAMAEQLGAVLADHPDVRPQG